MIATLKSANALVVILIVGSLSVLSFLLISNPLKVNQKANLCFGTFLLLWTTFWVEEVYLLIGQELNPRWLLPVIRYLQLTVPFLFYYSVLLFTNPYHKIGIRDVVHFILLAGIISGLIVVNEFSPEFLGGHFFVLSLMGQALYFTISSFVLLEQHRKRVELFSSNREEVDLGWIKRIIISAFLVSVFIACYNLVVPGLNLNVAANSIILFIIFFIAYHAIGQKEIFIINKEEMQQILQSEGQSDIGKQKLLEERELNELKNKLLQLMEIDKPYLEGELSLSKLASRMQVSPHQLSYLLNEGFRENFFQFVNKYRVEEAKKLLLSKDHHHLSILGIAYEAGFNSKTAFNTVFKKNTGITPSIFQKRGSSG